MRSKVLPARLRGVRFEEFAAGFLEPRNEPRWRSLIESLRAATPAGSWAPNLDSDLRSIILNYAWAAATRPRRDEQPVDADLRKKARRAVAAFEKAAAAYEALGEAYGSELRWDLGPGVTDRKALAEAIMVAPPSRGGRPDKPQFEFLASLCGSLYGVLTGLPRSSFIRAPEFIRVARDMTDLAEAAQRISGLNLLVLPSTAEAFRKRMERLALLVDGQNGGRV